MLRLSLLQERTDAKGQRSKTKVNPRCPEFGSVLNVCPLEGKRGLGNVRQSERLSLLWNGTLIRVVIRSVMRSTMIVFFRFSLRLAILLTLRRMLMLYGWLLNLILRFKEGVFKMLCRRCGFWTCKCGQRKLSRFLVGSVLVIVSAIGIQWVWDSRPHPTCNVSSQGICFGNPNGGNQ
jgi:hypothetical protein